MARSPDMGFRRLAWVGAVVFAFVLPVVFVQTGIVAPQTENFLLLVPVGGLVGWGIVRATWWLIKRFEED